MSMVNRMKRQAAAKRKKREEEAAKAKKLGPTGTFAFRLTEDETHHNGEDTSETIGIYNSKEAAISASNLVETAWGSIDEAKEYAAKDEDLAQYPDLIQDFRENAPDNGIVWQFGDGENLEGDIQTVSIEKLEVSESDEQPKKKKRKAKK